jgi:hypothetical protein
MSNRKLAKELLFCPSNEEVKELLVKAHPAKETMTGWTASQKNLVEDYIYEEAIGVIESALDNEQKGTLDPLEFRLLYLLRKQ